jgi:hypothetical protein
VLVCSERKVPMAGCWWLVCCERKVLLAVSQANRTAQVDVCGDVAGGGYDTGQLPIADRSLGLSNWNRG